MVWFISKDMVLQIFIHIPKTGGTSIETALCLLKHGSGYGQDKNNKSMQHYLWRDYKKKFDRVFNISYKFAVCRNPYDRVVSDYYWFPGIGHKGGHSMDEFISHCECVVRQELYTTTIYHDHFIPQHKYIFDDNAKLMVNTLFRFENFGEIDNFLENKYGIKKVPKLNVCNHTKLTLNDKQKERIYKIYNKDFELLGYPK
jgi:hypothetical protein